MNGLKIDQNGWKEYFDEFSRRNRARIVSVEIFGEFGVQKEIKKMPLSGVVFENGKDDSSFLELMFENNRSGEKNHLTHFIAGVQNVFPKQTIDGRDEALEIEDAGGNKTLLVFEHLPELGAGSFHAAASRRLW
jgi:hypothetical protein